MNPIIQIFTGHHIDLSKVLAMGNAEIISVKGGYNQPGFRITFQLQNDANPSVFTREYNQEEMDLQQKIEEEHKAKYPNDLSYTFGYIPLEVQELALKNCQAQVDQLIEIWKQFNEKTL